ncbi:MAG: hypothetical protein BWY68_00821 [bacterium ADurb.Bin400]|nr:MAG: hypothetical protein BWY68_00821 [bacterium ADurb.Bin400]
MNYRIKEVINYIFVFAVIPTTVAALLSLLGIPIFDTWEYADWTITIILVSLAVYMLWPRKKSDI